MLFKEVCLNSWSVDITREVWKEFIYKKIIR